MLRHLLAVLFVGTAFSTDVDTCQSLFTTPAPINQYNNTYPLFPPKDCTSASLSAHTDLSLNLTSPCYGFPLNFHYVNCTTTIQAVGDSQFIELRFVDVSYDVCDYNCDVATIYDTDLTPLMIVSTFTRKGTVVTSSGPSLTVSFRTGDHVSGRGFLATYKAQQMSTLAPSTTVADTTRVQPTTLPQTPAVTTPVPVTPSPGGGHDRCSCVPKQVWLDVMVLIDSSASMTADGINQASAYVLAAMDKLTIGQVYGYNTRVGVITFGNNATLVSHLTDFTSNDDLFNNAVFPFKNENSANIEAAIKLASTEFDSGNHRSNAQKVILLVSSTYTYGRVNDPRQAAENFKADTGIIITVEYIQEHGDPVPELCGLASSGYCLSNRVPINTDQLVSLFCEANCFCAKNLQYYGVDGMGAPVDGCLEESTIPTTQRLAERVCRESQETVGVCNLVTVTNQMDFDILTTAFKTPKIKFWLGLKRCGNTFCWQDGTPMTYSHWGPGQPATGDCVYMYQYAGFLFGWFTDDCSNDHDYVCQHWPCSSANYCP